MADFFAPFVSFVPFVDYWGGLLEVEDEFGGLEEEDDGWGVVFLFADDVSVEGGDFLSESAVAVEEGA